MKAMRGQSRGVHIQMSPIGGKKTEPENCLVGLFLGRESSLDLSNAANIPLSLLFFFSTNGNFDVRNLVMWTGHSHFWPRHLPFGTQEKWALPLPSRSHCLSERLTALWLATHLVSFSWRVSWGIKWDNGYGALNKMPGIWQGSSRH